MATETAVFLGMGCVSIVCNAVVIYSYVKQKSLRRHPNGLVVGRAILDTILCFTFFDLLETGCDDARGAVSSFITQSSILAAEFYFLMLSVDMVVSLSNPFTNVSSNQKWYHTTSCIGGVLSGILLMASHGYGQSSIGLCWTSFQKDAWNVYSWGFFFVPLLLIYGVCVGCLIFSWRRLTQTMTKSQKVKKHVIRSLRRYVLAYSIYWGLTASTYMIVFKKSDTWNLTVGKDGKPVTTDDSVTVGFILVNLGLIGGRGVITLFVWILEHGKKAFLMAPSSGSTEVDLQPLINKTLREETLFFTTKGIAAALERAQHQKVRKTYSDVNTIVLHAGMFTSDPMDSTDASDNPLRELSNKSNKGEDLQSSLLPNSPSLAAAAESGPEFLFKDHRPFLFEELRNVFGVDTESYRKSLSQHARERFSEGASGAFMYFTADNKYIVKTTEEEECKFLLRILPVYTKYVKARPDTLLPKFFGCHSLKMYRHSVNFIVIANVFNTDQTIHERFDLKGSWINRHAETMPKGKKTTCQHCNLSFYVGDESGCPALAGSRRHSPNRVFKDNDLTHRMYIDKGSAERLALQARRDVEFLVSQGAMDFSLLLGISRKKYDVTRSLPLSPDVSRPPTLQQQHSDNERKRENASCGISCNVVEGPGTYYLGIIDSLQEWNWNKKLERFVKVYLKMKDKHGISAVPPEEYGERFIERVVDAIIAPVNLDSSASSVASLE